MFHSNLVLIQREEDYFIGPPRIRKTFSSIRSLKDSFPIVEIFDFIPYSLQEIEPAVELEDSLAATGHCCSQHYRQIPTKNFPFVCPGLTSVCSRNMDVCSNLPSLVHHETPGYLQDPEPPCNLGNQKLNLWHWLAEGASYPLLKHTAQDCWGPAKKHITAHMPDAWNFLPNGKELLFLNKLTVYVNTHMHLQTCRSTQIHRNTNLKAICTKRRQAP